jgi:hypothetical protein
MVNLEMYFDWTINVTRDAEYHHLRSEQTKKQSCYMGGENLHISGVTLYM